MIKIGKHQLENNLFLEQNENSKQKYFQKFDESANYCENIQISILKTDFTDGITGIELKAIQNEWIEKLPSLKNIKELSIRHNVNDEFLESVSKMSNLESLHFWASSIEDLTPLIKLKKLSSLELCSFPKLKDIKPIVGITSIKKLAVENCFNIANYELIGKMRQLVALKIEGNSTSPKNLNLRSLKYFTELKNLQHLNFLFTTITDKSYTEILKLESLTRLDALWKMDEKVRNEIKERHKSLKSGFFVVYDFKKNQFYDQIEWW